VAERNDLEQLVRTRLRSLRTTLGLSLDELAARANLSASTISRVETGKRTISLDILLPLATALQIDLDSLLDEQHDDDVVIRPTPNTSRARTTWLLTRPTGNILAVKMRLEPTRDAPEQRVHPGHDWFFVLEGRVRLWLGEREIVVEAGEAAEFATMTPHAFAAIDGPAELVTIFDRDGHRAHVHREANPERRDHVTKAHDTESAPASARIDAVIAQLTDWRGDTLARMRKLIHDADRGVVEEVKWVKPSNPAGVPTWSHDGIICTGEVYKATVKLTFANGASLDDPAGLFNSSLTGNTRRAIDIHEGEKVDARAFKALIKAAVDFNAARAKSKRTK
jgi:transcriptional regulator with XRE-family HTH domain